jgi:hypothetical protein
VFNPAEVYKRLYYEICIQLGRRAFQSGRQGGLLLLSAFSTLVLTNLESFFTYLLQGQSAKIIHKGVLMKYVEQWRHIRNSHSCFTCFVSVPRHILQCGHAICDNCIQIFSEPKPVDPHLFILHKCTLCQERAELIVRFRPPTAGQGLLCVDGGGVGGVVSTTILELVEARLNLPIPIQEHFSMAYGVSVGRPSSFVLNSELNVEIGGLVVLGLYQKGWSAATCTLKLQTLATEAFYKPAYLLPIIFLTFKWIHLLLFGSLYSGKGIEHALKSVFGDQKIATPSHASAIGTKIGILTTSVDPPMTNLFTNYNGVGDARTGYIVRSGCDNVMTWEV